MMRGLAYRAIPLASYSEGFWAMIRQNGFNLLELMITLFLGLLLTALVLPVFIGNLKTFESAKAIANTQENARFALSEIARVIRNTGFKGCDSQTSNISNTTGNNLFAFDTVLEGVERSASETVPAITDNTIQIKSATDAITLKHLQVTGSILSSAASSGSTTLTLNHASDFTAGDLIFIGDCQSAVISTIDSISSNQLTLTNALAGSGPFTEGTNVFRFESVTYFIAESQLYVNNRGQKPNALWRKVNNRAAEELVAGIEDLQFIYGIDESNDGTPNRFLTAAQAAANITSTTVVRFKILATSLDALKDNDVVSKPFSMTVRLRNNS